MAEQLALVKRDDIAGDVNSVSLLAWLMDSGWQHAPALS